MRKKILCFYSPLNLNKHSPFANIYNVKPPRLHTLFSPSFTAQNRYIQRSERHIVNYKKTQLNQKIVEKELPTERALNYMDFSV